MEEKDRESRKKVCRKGSQGFWEKNKSVMEHEIQNGGINPKNTMLSTQRTPLYNGLCETEKDDFTVHIRWRRPVIQHWTEKCQDRMLQANLSALPLSFVKRQWLTG